MLQNEVEKAEELVSCGERMLRGRHYLHLDCVAPKCEELQRLSVTLADRLQRRSDFLTKCRELQESIDKVSLLIGMDLYLFCILSLSILINFSFD